jgi:Arc/MetJ-type ribon-helix-helix transcriptional regulator
MKTSIKKLRNMAAPKNNRNNLKARKGQFEPTDDPTLPVTVRVPQSIAQELEALLSEGESRSSAILEGIKLWINERSGDPTLPVTVDVPQSIAQQLEALLSKGESRSSAILKGIKLWINERLKVTPSPEN